MLKNAKIRTKIAMAFGLVIVVAMGTIVWLISQMIGIAETTQSLYAGPYAASNYSWNIRRNLIDCERALYKLVAVDASEMETVYADAEQTILGDAQEILNSIEGFRKISNSQEELTLLDEIEASIKQGGETRQEIMRLAKIGQTEQAMALLTDSYEPLFDQCNAKVLELFGITSQDAGNFVEAARSSSRTSIIVGLILIVLGLAAALTIVIVFSAGLVRPLKQLENAAEEMSRGNLRAVGQITYRSRNEIGQLADCLRTTMTTLSAYVDEISRVLNRLAKGDLTVPSNQITDYLGDFSEIKRSLVTILKSFNNTLGDINRSAAEVDSGSAQVSNAAQLLSQGATEQANAIEELTSTVEEISAQIRETADNAQSANELTSQVSLEVEESNHKMEEMSEAMSQISQSSQEIGKIIKTIEDIAFQTNILALNAAVEAARAGAAGKGFAVVADEVRNLASKSAEASKNTASLIEHSVRAVENGAGIAVATAQSLGTVAATTREVVETVNRIAEASAKQAASVEAVSNRVEEISTVVQTNSATAEESAAASEELSSQANLLNELVDRFHLYHGENAPVHVG